MKHFLYPALFLALFFSGCTSLASPGTSSGARTLNVFAAASLTDAFTELGQQFEVANPGVTVIFNFAASQALVAQIEEGAPADIFASANQKEMDALIASTFIAQNASRIFLSNKLVVIVPADNPAELKRLEELAKPGIKLVLAAEEVPVGKYARQALDQMNGLFGTDFKDNVLVNVVSNEDNVKQVVAKVQLGEADAGIVYTSDAVAAPDLKTVEIPAEWNVTANYPIAPLTASSEADLAAAFIDYVLAPDGQAVLQKWGFAPAE